jgi:hypothetical protein
MAKHKICYFMYNFESVVPNILVFQYKHEDDPRVSKYAAV